jgi:hypothetical protein
MSLLFPKSRDLVRLGIAHTVPNSRLLRRQTVACALRLRQRERDYVSSLNSLSLAKIGISAQIRATFPAQN